MKDTGKRIQTDDSDNSIAIKVEHVYKTFRLPHNRQNSLKGSLINLVKGGERTYEKQEVLKDVSFEIKKGEFFGIVGRNGSGKSTLLKMLAGIYKPSGGCITVNGSLTPFIELGVGFNPELTGRENVYLNGALLGFSNADMNEMYDDIVAFAELERFMDQKLKNYSSGMQVRLAFSIAIRANSKILLLDEVLAVGDGAFQQKCIDYFYKLKKNRQTVVFVSHDMSSVKRFCDKVMVVDRGKILGLYPADKGVQKYEDLNLPELIDERNPHTPSANQSTDSTLETKIGVNIKGRGGAETLSYGEDIYINLNFKSLKRGAAKIRLSVNIHDNNGLLIAALQSDVKRLSDLKNHQQLVINEPNLSPGVYTIYSGVYPEMLGSEAIAVTNDGVTFGIKAGDGVYNGGSVQLMYKWNDTTKA